MHGLTLLQYLQIWIQSSSELRCMQALNTQHSTPVCMLLDMHMQHCMLVLPVTLHLRHYTDMHVLLWYACTPQVPCSCSAHIADAPIARGLGQHPALACDAARHNSIGINFHQLSLQSHNRKAGVDDIMMLALIQLALAAHAGRPGT